MYGSAGGPWCTAFIPSGLMIPELDARVKSGDVGVATIATDDEPLDGERGVDDGRPPRSKTFVEEVVG